MNANIVFALGYIAWLLTKVKFSTLLPEKGRFVISDFITLSFIYLALLLVPVLSVLNNAVETHRIIDEGTDEKLQHLKLNVRLLMKQCESEEEKLKL